MERFYDGGGGRKDGGHGWEAVVLGLRTKSESERK